MGDKLIMSKKELKRKSIFELVKAGHLSRQDASVRLGLSYRQTRRSYQRYVQAGDVGLVHQSRGKVSSRAFKAQEKEAILKLYEERYWDFGPTLAAEKLREEDGHQVHAETLRLWLKASGKWLPRRKRKAHRSRRMRRARFGELLQLDGSIHAWLPGVDGKQCLMNLVDDATGKTLSLLASGETTEATFRLLKWWIEMHGVPMAVYVDLKSLYVSPKSLRVSDEDELVEAQWLTHFSRACQTLGIEVIKAYSPQAKGRVERSHGVYQDRLVKELRLKSVRTLEGANAVLQGGFINHLNRQFMKLPASEEDAHVGLMGDEDLDTILCWEHTRTVQNDWVIQFENQLFQIHKSHDRQVAPKQKIKVKKQLNGKITLWAKNSQIPYCLIKQRHKQEEKKVAREYSSEKRSQVARANKEKSPWSQFNPGWLKQTKIHPPIAVTT